MGKWEKEYFKKVSGDGCRGTGEARGSGKVKISGLVDEWTGGRGRQKEVPGVGGRGFGKKGIQRVICDGPIPIALATAQKREGRIWVNFTA